MPKKLGGFLDKKDHYSINDSCGSIRFRASTRVDGKILLEINASGGYWVDFLIDGKVEVEDCCMWGQG